MKKILVPTDLSETAELGLQLAVEIARRCGATISLVNFTKHPYGPTFSATGDVMLKKDPEEDRFGLELLNATQGQLEQLASKYVTSEFRIETAIVDNEFKHGIDEYLQAESIDMIVMGTTGEESAKEVFTGNHTEQAIRVCSCPVLSIRDGFNAEDLNCMVVGVNVITDNKLADGLRSIRALAACFDAHIHLVHVRDNSTDSNLLLDQYFNQMAVIAELPKYTVRVIDARDVSEALSSYAEEVNAGLIAVIKNGKEGIFRIFSNKRVSNRLLKEEGGPVVTVKL